MNQEFFIKYEKWCFYINTENYKTMKPLVKDTFKKILHNINLRKFDTCNINHNRYDDWLRCQCEMELNRRNIDLEQYELSTYDFLHHLQFVDKDEKRNLHETLRNFIFADDEDCINCINKKYNNNYNFMINNSINDSDSD